MTVVLLQHLTTEYINSATVIVINHWLHLLSNIFVHHQALNEDVTVTNIAILLEENPGIAGESSALLYLSSNCMRIMSMLLVT